MYHLQIDVRILKKQEENSKAGITLIHSIFCVLNRILAHSDENNMNAYNLTVCISSSMMWPEDLNKAHQCRDDIVVFFQFLLENCQEILGQDMENVLGDVGQPVRHKANRRRAAIDSSTIGINGIKSNENNIDTDDKDLSSSPKTIQANLARRLANAETCGSNDSGFANSDLLPLGLENDDNSQCDNGSIATSESSGGQETVTTTTATTEKMPGANFGGVERHETKYGRFIKSLYQGNKQKGDKGRDSRSAFASNSKKNSNTNSPFLNKTRAYNGRRRQRDDSACSEDSTISSVVGESFSKDSPVDEDPFSQSAKTVSGTSLESVSLRLAEVTRQQSTPAKARGIGGMMKKKFRNNSLGDGEEYSTTPIAQHKSSFGNNSDESDSTLDSKSKSRFASCNKVNKKSVDYISKSNISSSTPASPVRKDFESSQLKYGGSQPDVTKMLDQVNAAALDLSLRDDIASNCSTNSISSLNINEDRNHSVNQGSMHESHSDSQIKNEITNHDNNTVESLRKVDTFPTHLSNHKQSLPLDITSRERAHRSSETLSSLTKTDFLKMSFTDNEFV